MGRIYTIPLEALSVTNDADQDIWELVANSAKPCRLHGFSLTSSYTTDERVKLRLVRRSTTGSGGSALTEVPVDDDDTTTPSAALSALVTTPGTIGDILRVWRWGQQGELLWLPTPELRDGISAGGRLCLNLGTALGGTRTWDGWVSWEELG